MDLLHFGVLVWFLCLSVVEGNINISDDVTSVSECRQCKPGFYASRMCSNIHDTICSPCPSDMFTSEANTANQCTACTKCKAEQYENEVCSHDRDTVCKSCYEFLIDASSERFLSECSKYLGLKSNSSGLELQFGRSEIEKETDSLEGSGIEGDGESILTPGNIHLFNDTELVLTNTTDEDGSGDLSIVFPSRTEPNSSSSHPTLAPEEEETEELIPVTTKAVSTTQKSDDSYEITSPTTRSLSTTTEFKFQQEVVAVLNTSHEKSIQLPNTTTTTTESTASDKKTTLMRLLQPSQGISLPIPTVKYQTEPPAVHKDDLRRGGQPLIDEPIADASKTQESESGEGGNVAVGVVVAIAIVAAVVFFIIGFMVSRYCRRDHGTFNVLKAIKRNGLPSQDSAIEYRDPEVNSGRGTSIYDEIPATEKQNGKTTETRPPPAVGEDNVYSKPLKRSERKPESEVKVEPSGSKEVDNPEAEPLNEIQFIDETTDDELETASQMDRLLPSVENSNGSSGGSGNQPVEDDNQLAEETPMLNKSEPKQQLGSPAREGQKNENT